MNVGNQGILLVNVAFALVLEDWEVEDAEARVLDIEGALAMGVEATVREEDLFAVTHLAGNGATVDLQSVAVATAGHQSVAVATADLQSAAAATAVHHFPMLTGIAGKQGIH